MMQAGIVLQDLLRTVRLMIDGRARHEKVEKVLGLQTLHERFEFARSEFGISQIESEISSFLEFAAREKPRTVCEVGVADGGNSFLLCQALPDVSLFIGIDLYVRNRYPLTVFCGRDREMLLINSGSTNAATLAAVRQKLAGRSIDLAFIDGNHEYEAAARDFLEYSKMVRDGGLIAFHDIVPDRRPGLQRTLDSFSEKIPRLWSELKSIYPSHEFVADRAQDGAGIGVIVFSRNIPLPNLEEKKNP